ncbi:MAG: zinc ribbon domain-containing protein [Myxococcota bacterium]|nr:zinc ribbon domain-containing protein [Myxococcota bacterium]
MTPRFGWLVAMALWAAVPALAQPAPEATPEPAAATPDIPDVPAGPATLRGLLVHDDPTRAGDVEVLLYALPGAGPPGLRRTRSDAQGRFVFSDISNDPETAYLVGARYAGIPFPGTRVAFASGQTEREIRVHIGEATEDPGTVSVTESELRVQWVGARLVVTEVHRIRNEGTRTVYVAPERRGTLPPAFRTRLPEGAEGFGIPFGIEPEGLVRDGADVHYYGPVYPSGWDVDFAAEQGFRFFYSLPTGEGTLDWSKPFAQAAERVVVLAPADGPEVVVEGAVAAGEVQVDGRAMRRQVLEGGVPGGAGLTLAVSLPASRDDPDAVQLAEARIFLELDDAALLVREEHALRVEGDTPVAAGAGEALLKLPLPSGARDLRFDRSSFAHGLDTDGAGQALLRGPLPPGETTLEVSYHLPASGGPFRFERSFDRELPLLTVYVADTGLRLETDRLHRRRPIRTPDRIYLQLEAFQIDPGETVSLGLAPLAARSGPPRTASYALIALAAALVAGLLLGPLRGAGAAATLIDEVEDAHRREREAVYAALRDLEHDHETGKLSDADHARMRQELRARAATLIQAERDASQATTPTPSRPPARAEEADEAAGASGGEAGARSEPKASEVHQDATTNCPKCNEPAPSDHRFCAQCGAALAPEEREAQA